ncbi:MAG: VOC family protein [Candidatus Dormibacteraeota bacterium]|nr:VOC family protein [Candidatus Dormibacteraeota bacterium]
MQATNLNHVSVCARDLEASVAFYREFLGLEPVPTPNFGFPVQWLRCGPLQVHLFVRPEEAVPRYYHFGVTVDDFTGLYRKARDRDLFDRVTFGHHVYELPGGCAQMYVRDPTGNCIELDTDDAAGIDRSVVNDMIPLRPEQSAENLRSTLFLASAAGGERVR